MLAVQSTLARQTSYSWPEALMHNSGTTSEILRAFFRLVQGRKKSVNELRKAEDSPALEPPEDITDITRPHKASCIDHCDSLNALCEAAGAMRQATVPPVRRR